MDNKLIIAFLIVLIIFIVATIMLFKYKPGDICTQYDTRNTSHCISSHHPTTFEKLQSKMIIGIFAVIGAIGTAYLGHALITGKKYADVSDVSQLKDLSDSAATTFA